MSRGKRWREYLLWGLATAAILVICVGVGSVTVSPGEIWRAIWGDGGEQVSRAVIVTVRLPRVLCVALVGAALSLSGAAMQGLLRNPLADGSTLGVSAGASMGAALAIAFGLTVPGAPGGGVTVMAMLFAFLSVLGILGLAYRLDYSLATNSIILIGVIFSMFANSVISLIVTFAGDKVKNILFWTMGSLAGSKYSDALTLAVALLVGGGALLLHCEELNAFAIGEENARHVGIPVRRVKLIVLVAVSALIGISVSIGGNIAFVGLVLPHITRMLTGPNHKRLLPVSLFSGACFLMLADLVSRVILRPRELPIGVITSFVGAVMFVHIFYSTRKGR